MLKRLTPQLRQLLNSLMPYSQSAKPCLS
jgi:hypothetical protein